MVITFHLDSEKPEDMAKFKVLQKAEQFRDFGYDFWKAIRELRKYGSYSCIKTENDRITTDQLDNLFWELLSDNNLTADDFE